MAIFKQKSVFAVVMCLLLFYFSACSNSGTENKEDIKAIDSNKIKRNQPPLADDSSKMFAPIEKELGMVYIEEELFKRIVQTNNSNLANGKLLLQFSLPEQGQNLSKLTLVINSFKNNGYHQDKVYLKNDIDRYPETLNAKDILGVQKLHWEKVQRVLDSLGSANDGQIVAFKPVKINNRFKYEVAVFQSLEFLKNNQTLSWTTIAETNPSPPASENPNFER